MVTKNKLKHAIANLAFRLITKKVRQRIATNKISSCHFVMYRLNNFPNGKLEKNQVSLINNVITSELSQPISVAKNGIKLNGISATLNQSITADNGIAKILASKKYVGKFPK